MAKAMLKFRTQSAWTTSWTMPMLLITTAQSLPALVAFQARIALGDFRPSSMNSLAMQKLVLRNFVRMQEGGRLQGARLVS